MHPALLRVLALALLMHAMNLAGSPPTQPAASQQARPTSIVQFLLLEVLVQRVWAPLPITFVITCCLVNYLIQASPHTQSLFCEAVRPATNYVYTTSKPQLPGRMQLHTSPNGSMDACALDKQAGRALHVRAHIHCSAESMSARQLPNTQKQDRPGRYWICFQGCACCCQRK
jgi:hypothetical protein